MPHTALQKPADMRLAPMCLSRPLPILSVSLSTEGDGARGRSSRENDQQWANKKHSAGWSRKSLLLQSLYFYGSMGRLSASLLFQAGYVSIDVLHTLLEASDEERDWFGLKNISGFAKVPKKVKDTGHQYLSSEKALTKSGHFYCWGQLERLEILPEG